MRPQPGSQQISEGSKARPQPRIGAYLAGGRVGVRAGTSASPGGGRGLHVVPLDDGSTLGTVRVREAAGSCGWRHLKVRLILFLGSSFVEVQAERDDALPPHRIFSALPCAVAPSNRLRITTEASHQTLNPRERRSKRMCTRGAAWCRLSAGNQAAPGPVTLSSWYRLKPCTLQHTAPVNAKMGQLGLQQDRNLAMCCSACSRK